MYAKANYTEPCVCGNPLEQVTEERIWRFVTWKCPSCGKVLAQTMVSDSPVTGAYVLKKLLTVTNTLLRKEKGLPPKRTIVTFYDENGKRIPWEDIKTQNAKWEKKVGAVQRKPF
jgi:hypothetical protein